MVELEEAAREVFDVLGPGFSESVYHTALETELSERGVPFSSEGTIPVIYKDFTVGRRHPDMFVGTDDGLIVVELKAGSNRGVDQLAQYVALMEHDGNFDLDYGCLIQFNEELEIIKTRDDDD